MSSNTKPLYNTIPSGVEIEVLELEKEEPELDDELIQGMDLVVNDLIDEWRETRKSLLKKK